MHLSTPVAFATVHSTAVRSTAVVLLLLGFALLRVDFVVQYL